MERSQINLTGLTILIVDDQPLSIKLMEALLKQKGFKTNSANSTPPKKWCQAAI